MSGAGGRLPMTILLIIGGIAALIVAFVWFTYNRLTRLRLACQNSWAQIDVALKLRHDLVPSLVETVAGYAGHERATLERTTQARGQAAAATGAGPGSQGPLEGLLGAGIRNLILIAEQYPDLKASENFAALQTELAAIEERIAITRRVYNDTVETLNTAVAIFPSSVVARAFSFEPRDFFSAGVEREAAPAVEVGQ